MATCRSCGLGNRKVLAYLREHEGQVILVRLQPVPFGASSESWILASQRGKVPVELTGASAFPPIGTLPYLLTLPAYGFYWFMLADPAQLPSHPEQEPESLPELETFVLGEGWMVVESQRRDTARDRPYRP